MAPMLTKNTVDKVRQLFSEKNYSKLNHLLSNLHTADIAELFEQLSAEDSAMLFRLLHKDHAADVFSYLSAANRKAIVSSINKKQLADILEELNFDDKIDFLEEMPANFVKDIIASSPSAERGLINQFLNYPVGCAGSLMTIEYVELKKAMTVSQAMERIMQDGVDKETIYTCYVIDDFRSLLGSVSLRKLVLSRGQEIIGSIMQKDVVSVSVQDDQEKVAALFKKYDLIAIPVVDEEKRLVGIITIDDIVDVIEQESTEDFEKMAGMSPSDDAYLDTGVFTLARKRIVWLLILMLTATLTGGIISHFESLLSAAVILTAFIPMLMNSGGNAGSQTSTLIIRGMALGEIRFCDYPKILWKEFRVGLIAGLVLAAVNFARMWLLNGNDIPVNIAVSATLFLTVIMAKLVGGTMPILAKALRLDPAIMAGPFITTIVDTVSLIIYFSIASLLVG